MAERQRAAGVWLLDARIQVPLCARCGTLITSYHNCIPAGSTTIKQPFVWRVWERP